jgi:hypothetical protein
MASREIICFHEAAHAVACLAKGIGIDNIIISVHTIIPGNGGVASAYPTMHEGDLQSVKQVNDDRLRIFLTLIAPVATEKRFGSDSRKGDVEDYNKAKGFARNLQPDSPDALYNEVHKEVLHFLDDRSNWEKIERIGRRMTDSNTAIFPGNIVLQWFNS